MAAMMRFAAKDGAVLSITDIGTRHDFPVYHVEVWKCPGEQPLNWRPETIADVKPDVLEKSLAPFFLFKYF